MSKFDNLGRELSDAELSAVQGGFLGGIVDAIGDGFKAVGETIADGAKAVGGAFVDGAKAIADGFANMLLGEVKRRARSVGY